MWDIVSVAIYWARYIASIYNTFGFMPESVPKDTFFNSSDPKQPRTDGYYILDQLVAFGQFVRQNKDAGGSKK